MTEHTRISPDGGLNLPREETDREGWTPESELEVVHTEGVILIRPKQGLPERISWEEFDRRRPRYDGPPASLEKMDRTILDEVQNRYRGKTQRR